MPDSAHSAHTPPYPPEANRDFHCLTPTPDAAGRQNPIGSELRQKAWIAASQMQHDPANRTRNAYSNFKQLEANGGDWAVAAVGGVGGETVALEIRLNFFGAET